MRVYCSSCTKRAIITSRQEISKKLAKLYCVCSDPHCGHGFVIDMQFSHTLSPSALHLPKETREAVKKASHWELLSLFSLPKKTISA